nr:unnamed protein product [uncultured bacterium]
MANINQKPSHRANLSKNGFDMSQRHPFTSSVGQLLPVFYDYLNPGDKIRISANLFTRTQPMKSTAMARLTEHIEYFFVPFEQMFSLFGSVFYGIDDYNSSSLVKHNNLTMPFFKSDAVSAALEAAYTSFSSSINRKVLTPDMMGQPRVYGILRLSEMLGYGSLLLSNDNNLLPHADMSVFLFTAYQKIFNDFYRLDDYTSVQHKSYNVDYAQGQPITDNSMFELHYRPWKKDYFTNVIPNPYFSSVDNKSSFGGAGLFDRPVGLSITSFNFDGSDFLQAPSDLSTMENNQPIFQELPVNLTSASSAGLSVSDLRYLYATDKLLRITQFAGKHYDAQTLAHFGKRVPQGVSGEVYYIGGQSQPLQISSVESTATTFDSGDVVGSVLGELAGKGYSQTGNQKDFSFEAPCHGVLMAIYSAVPEADYLDERIDYLNTLIQSNDFYKPEFDSLGMEPFPNYELDQYRMVGNNSRLGWRYRYSGLKSKPDLISGAFKYTLRDWVAVRNDSRYAEDESWWQSAAFMYIDPAYLDNIFELSFTPRLYQQQDSANVTYDGTFIDRSLVYQRDPLLHDLYIKCYKSSAMSTYGLPNL